ncbi:MAG: hypothetical protein V4489_04270 [Chlamydiota bacterium]
MKITTSDLNNPRLVNKEWKKVFDGPLGQVFRDAAATEVSIREGVPMVQGENRDRKDDYMFLRSITISSKVIGRYLGEVVGKVPLMREDRFIQLRYSQDYFEPKNSKRETHIVIVDPSHLKITVGPNRPLREDSEGTLTEVPSKNRSTLPKREITIPFSFKNLKMLADFPLAGNENGPLFRPNCEPKVFNQCNTPPDHNKILIMRKEVTATYSNFDGKQGQRALVTNRKWEVVTVRQRGFHNIIKILETGTCPDGGTKEIFARGAESFEFSGRIYNPIIGGFKPKIGMGVCMQRDYELFNVGVVPGIFAEVLDGSSR